MTALSIVLLALAAVLLAADTVAFIWSIFLPWLRERRIARQRAESARTQAALDRAEQELRLRLRVGGLQARRLLIQAAAQYSAARGQDRPGDPGR